MKLFKKDYKTVFAFILGIVLSGVTVYATTYIVGSNVTIDNTNMGLTKNNQTVTNVQDAIEAIYTKANSVGCPSGYEMVQLGSYALVCRNVNAPICKRATTLHTETCNQGTNDDSYYCYYDGYYVGGSKNTTTITYGKLGQTGVRPEIGEAFDCDVNKDGQFSAATERFYYVSDYFDTNTETFDTTRATLIYYKNFVNGQASDGGVAYYGTSSAYDNWHGPTTAISSLPVASSTPTGNQWRDDLLKTTDRKILSCDAANCTTLTNSTTGGTITYTTPIYNGKAARLLTVKEINAGCGTNVGSIGSLSGDCNFLMERTYYANPSGYPTYGPWLENPRSASATLAWHVNGYDRRVDDRSAYSAYHGARPAIDVLYSDILY